jgi:glycolate oxidase FAD binding subunit
MTPDDSVETARPASEAEVARVLADAQGAGLKVTSRGGGTKSDWGNPAAGSDRVLSTSRLNRVLEHAAGDMTVTVESGCTIAALQQHVARRNQRLALDPLWPGRATVGGVIATNDSGSLRHAFGGLRDLILGVTVALPDGTLARSGGKVVKNVAGYDLPKLMVGAFGTLGVITQATFRLHPLPASTRTFQFDAPSPREAGRFMLAVQDSPLAVTGLQLIADSHGQCSVAVRVEGSPAGTESSAAPIAALSAACGLASSPEGRDPWPERQLLWDLPGIIAKLTYPPARLAELCAALPGATWKLVAQGPGVALLATRENEEGLNKLAHRVRILDGSLVILRGDPDLKRRVNDTALGSSLPLMRAIKRQFDPSGTLNPGRMIGGI